MNSVNLNLASVTIPVFKPYLFSKATSRTSETVSKSGERNASQQVGLILSWHDQIIVVTWLPHYCP